MTDATQHNTQAVHAESRI